GSRREPDARWRDGPGVLDDDGGQAVADAGCERGCMTGEPRREVPTGESAPRGRRVEDTLDRPGGYVTHVAVRAYIGPSGPVAQDHLGGAEAADAPDAGVGIGGAVQQRLV